VPGGVLDIVPVHRAVQFELSGAVGVTPRVVVSDAPSPVVRLELGPESDGCIEVRDRLIESPSLEVLVSAAVKLRPSELRLPRGCESGRPLDQYHRLVRRERCRSGSWCGAPGSLTLLGR